MRIRDEIYVSMNRLRLLPQYFIDLLQKDLKYLSGKTFHAPGRKPIKTRKGSEGWNHAISRLQSHGRSVKVVNARAAIDLWRGNDFQRKYWAWEKFQAMENAAQFHCNDLGPKGILGIN